MLVKCFLCVCVTAELVVHGERVNRHAEAIAEALSDLKEAPAVTSAKLEEKVLMIYRILRITVATDFCLNLSQLFIYS